MVDYTQHMLSLHEIQQVEVEGMRPHPWPEVAAAAAALRLPAAAAAAAESPACHLERHFKDFAARQPPASIMSPKGTGFSSLRKVDQEVPTL